MILEIPEKLKSEFRNFIESEILKLINSIENKLSLCKESKVIEVKLDKLDMYCMLIMEFDNINTDYLLTSLKLRKRYNKIIKKEE